MLIDLPTSVELKFADMTLTCVVDNIIRSDPVRIGVGFFTIGPCLVNNVLSSTELTPSIVTGVNLVPAF